MINIQENPIIMIINKYEYQFFLFLAIILDFFIYKGFIFTIFLLFYYFIVLLISIIKRKNFKNSLIKFLSIVFLIIFSAFIAHMWNEEIKKKTVIYYNNSNLTKGYEEEKISAYNMSRQVKLYFENNKKVAAVYLFNFRKFTYDNENKWKEVD